VNITCSEDSIYLFIGTCAPVQFR